MLDNGVARDNSPPGMGGWRPSKLSAPDWTRPVPAVRAAAGSPHRHSAPARRVHLRHSPYSTVLWAGMAFPHGLPAPHTLARAPPPQLHHSYPPLVPSPPLLLLLLLLLPLLLLPLFLQGFARVEALDALAKKFVDAAADAKAKVVEEAEAALAKLEGEAKDNGALYVTFMKKAVEKVGKMVGKGGKESPGRGGKGEVVGGLE